MFRMTMSNLSGPTAIKSITDTPMDQLQPYVSKKSIVSCRNFCQLFPFHVLFDGDLIIKQLGVNLFKLSRRRVEAGCRLTDAFSLVQPKMAFTYGNILR